jgi:ABC-2 type transport system ATP-binding protein
MHLQVQGLDKYYGAHHVLHQIHLDIHTPLSLAIVGPNGSGKTTLLKCLFDLVPFQSGQIFIDGLHHQQIQTRKHLSFLPEKFNFYPQYTVEQSLQFLQSLASQVFNPQDPNQKMILDHLEITPLLKKTCKQLSKGQLQRMGLAHCLLSPAPLIILDEPFSGLDPIGQKELRDIIVQFRKQGRSFFINTHQLNEVGQIADHLVILYEGHLLFYGPLSSIQGSMEQFFLTTIEQHKTKKSSL